MYAIVWCASRESSFLLNQKWFQFKSLVNLHSRVLSSSTHGSHAFIEFVMLYILDIKCYIKALYTVCTFRGFQLVPADKAAEH